MILNTEEKYKNILWLFEYKIQYGIFIICVQQEIYLHLFLKLASLGHLIFSKIILNVFIEF